jgi:hypothetical protein
MTKAFECIHPRSLSLSEFVHLYSSTHNHLNISWGEKATIAFVYLLVDLGGRCDANNRKRTRAPTSSINLSLEFSRGRGGASLASLSRAFTYRFSLQVAVLRGQWKFPTSLSSPSACVFFFSLTSLNFNMKTTHRVGRLHKRVVYVKEIGTLSKG